MSDLLQIVDLNRYEAKIEDIWTMSFRVMDDIKESVRKEGLKLTKSLVTVLTRALEKDSSNSDSQEILGRLILLLLGNRESFLTPKTLKTFQSRLC